MLGVSTVMAVAQTPESLGKPRDTVANTQSFEVASVKPGDPSDFRMSIGLHPGGRFTAMNTPARFLIRWAYRVEDFQVLGGPRWIDTEAFGIEAKSSRTPSGKLQDLAPEQYRSLDMQVRANLQALLAERFHLEIHHETREHSVYRLILAKRGAKLVQASDTIGPAPQQVTIGLGELKGTGAPLAILAQTLSRQIGAVIIDETGLQGQYNFDLRWSPELAPSTTGIDDRAPDPSGPSLFTAIQEQLGLKLEPAKGPVDVLVIDRIERPTAN